MSNFEAVYLIWKSTVQKCILWRAITSRLPYKMNYVRKTIKTECVSHYAASEKKAHYCCLCFVSYDINLSVASNIYKGCPEKI